MHKAFYRIFAMTISIILILCLCAPCFAVGTVFDLANLGQLMWDAYASSHGIGVYYTSDGVHNSYGDEFSQSAFQLAWNDLYDRYKTFVGFTQSASAWAAEQIENVTIFQTPVDGSDKQYVGIEMAAPLVEWFDGFTTWLLGEEMDVPSDSGHYHTSGSFANPTIFGITDSSYKYNGVDLVQAYDGYVTGTYASSPISVTILAADGPILLYKKSNATSTVIISSDAAFSINFLSASGRFNQTVTVGTSTGSTYQFAYNGALSQSDATWSNVPAIPLSTSYIPANDPNYNAVVSGGEAISLAPKEKIRDGDGDIYIPSPSDVNYVPGKITKPTNIPWDNAYTNNPDLALNAMQEAVRANNDILELKDALTPNPVINPLVPFDIPSFNFNFSGIWHYVVSWIGSIRSGSSFIFSVWNNIPFSMTIPIYATAVVCIVVGIFRKVF